MRRFFLFILLAPLGLLAQDKGVHFEHELSWQEVKAKAKAENKYIFVDCFTTWCGPCKYMAANVFPQQEVGDYMNAKFISVKVQIDKTPGDAQHIKDWYTDAEAIEKDYAIAAYPTFLFFAPDGTPVHRMVGGGEAKEFITRSSDALDPDKQYYTLVKKVQQGTNNSPEILRKAAVAAKEAYDQKNASLFADQYLATQKDLFTKDNISFLGDFVTSSKSPYFPMFLKDGDKIDNVMGKDFASAKISSIIIREEIYPQLNQPGAPDWTAISSAIEKKYPGRGEEPVMQVKVMYYQQAGDWNNFQQAVTVYMAKYGAHASAQQLNNFAWTVFENCKDMSCVQQALEWSKQSLAKDNSPMFMDTYANILYKLGKKDEAIAMEQKAAAAAGAGDQSYQETLTKMSKGEKTWKD